MTDLELETLKQMRELCAEQMERAPTSCEYVDWRNKSWIIDGILDDAKERRELEKIDELTSDDPEENETENVTENKTESEDIEMSTSEVNGLVFHQLNNTATAKLKDTFRKIGKYAKMSWDRRYDLCGVLVKDNSLIFFATNGKSAYFSTKFRMPDTLISTEWYYEWIDFGDVDTMIKSLGKYDCIEMACADKQIAFRVGDKTKIIKPYRETGHGIFNGLYNACFNGEKIASVRLANATQFATVRKFKGRGAENDVMKISVNDGKLMLNEYLMEVATSTPTADWKYDIDYVYDHHIPKVFSGTRTKIDMRIVKSDKAYYFVFEDIYHPYGEVVINTVADTAHKLLDNGEPKPTAKPVTKATTELKQEETETPTAKTDDVAKAIHDKVVEQCGKKWTDDHLIIMTPNMKPTKPEPEKEETEMTATEIKPAQETGNFTFSVSTSPTAFECIGLDYKPGIDLTKPTDKKTPEPVECKRPDLGEFIQGNKTYELYRNDELKRYRLTFKRHLTKDERDFLWTNKWTWRKEFKCYQWGYTKNGDEAARNAIEYFGKR